MYMQLRQIAITTAILHLLRVHQVPKRVKVQKRQEQDHTTEMQREIGATDSVSGLNFNDMTKSLLDFDICTVVIFPCAYFLWEVPLLSGT